MIKGVIKKVLRNTFIKVDKVDKVTCFDLVY
jgi:hypothetical protein